MNIVLFFLYFFFGFGHKSNPLNVSPNCLCLRVASVYSIQSPSWFLFRFFNSFFRSPLILLAHTHVPIFNASFLGWDGKFIQRSLWLHFTLLHIESNYIVINYHINLFSAKISKREREIGKTPPTTTTTNPFITTFKWDNNCPRLCSCAWQW